MERRLELLSEDNARLEMVLQSVDETGVEEEVKKARIRAETIAEKKVEGIIEQMKKKQDEAEHLAFKAEMKVKILEDEKRICQTENLALKDRIRDFELNYVPKQRWDSFFEDIRVLYWRNLNHIQLNPKSPNLLFLDFSKFTLSL